MSPRPKSSPEQILDITFRLIAEHDVSGVSVEMIAAEAGVSKATIYRRWDTREALLTEAMTRVRRLELDIDTGSLYKDLTAMLGQLVGFLNRTDSSRVLASFLNAAVRTPSLATLQREISRDARSPYTRALQRAIERGEIASDVNTRLVVDILIAPFLYQSIVEHKRARPEDIPAVVDAVLASLSRGLERRRN